MSSSPAPTTAQGERWAVASPHPLASEAAAAAFADGGNAVDAALHAAITLAVVYPHMCGVGGDLFALVQHPDGTLVAINSSGRAPAAVDPEALRAEHGTSMPDAGPSTITVPGAVRGWEAVHRQGAVLGWSTAFATAIDAAEGTPVSPDLAGSLARRADDLRADPGFATTVYADGVPTEGDRLAQPALAATLRTLAQHGADSFHGGSLGAAFVEGLRASGAVLSLDDLAAHRADLGLALTARYRDLDVSVTPPPSQGFVLLQALAVLEHLALAPDPIDRDAATIAKILVAASADRDRNLADPDAMAIDVATLLDDGHVAAMAEIARGDLLGRATVASSRELRESGDTVALITADRDGWGVALIESLYSAFGAGILEPSTGIVPHDRGGCFTLEPGHPNELGPGKRPAHTLMPVAIHRDGALVGLTGTRGGHGQPQIDLMTVLRSFDLGLDAAAAVAAPRWLVGGMEPLAGDPWIHVEVSVPADVRDRFERDGFRVELLPELDRAVGHAQLIRIGEDGLDVGSDPRADAAALAG